MKSQAIPLIRRGTSNLEATGSNPVGRANYSTELRHFLPMQAAALQPLVGTMRKRAAQSEQILSQFKAQSFADRSASSEHSRVKRWGSNVNRENPCNAGSETAERAANMGQLSAGYTPTLPQGKI